MNPKLLINNHIQALFDLELIQQESGFSLRNRIVVINKNLRLLVILGEPTNHSNILIIFIMMIMQKMLDNTLSLQLAKSYAVSSIQENNEHIYNN